MIARCTVVDVHPVVQSAGSAGVVFSAPLLSLPEGIKAPSTTSLTHTLPAQISQVLPGLWVAIGWLKLVAWTAGKYLFQWQVGKSVNSSAWCGLLWGLVVAGIWKLEFGIWNLEDIYIN